MKVPPSSSPRPTSEAKQIRYKESRKKEKHLSSSTGKKERGHDILVFLGGVWGLFPAPEKKSYECVIFSDTPPSMIPPWSHFLFVSESTSTVRSCVYYAHPEDCKKAAPSSSSPTPLRLENLGSGSPFLGRGEGEVVIVSPPRAARSVATISRLSSLLFTGPLPPLPDRCVRRNNYTIPFGGGRRRRRRRKKERERRQKRKEEGTDANKNKKSLSPPLLPLLLFFLPLFSRSERKKRRQKQV